MSSYLRPPLGGDHPHVVGKGGFSVVIRTRDHATSQIIAVKRISADQEHWYLIQEVETLAGLKHPCVVRICGWSPPQGETQAEIRMEYAENKSLKDVIDKVNHRISPTFWNPTDIGIIICGLVLGMRFVHSRGIIHCDLKPSNILLGGQGRVLIADFGTSQSVYDDRTPVGTTAHYAAPELFEEGGKCTRNSDVFSFGLVLYEILAERPVFDCEKEPALDVIRRLRARNFPAIPAGCGELMCELIPRCWDADPGKRPSFEEIFRLFQDADFAIIPDGSPIGLRDYCQSVVAWEEGNPLRK
jgi:serine/threonine protein kinase